MREGTKPTPTPPDARAEEKPEETLVADDRAAVSPAQMVERKLLDLLGGGQLPASQLRSPLQRRRPF
jgi:hypothetical protein